MLQGMNLHAKVNENVSYVLYILVFQLGIIEENVQNVPFVFQHFYF